MGLSVVLALSAPGGFASDELGRMEAPVQRTEPILSETGGRYSGGAQLDERRGDSVNPEIYPAGISGTSRVDIRSQRPDQAAADAVGNGSRDSGHDVSGRPDNAVQLSNAEIASGNNAPAQVEKSTVQKEKVFAVRHPKIHKAWRRTRRVSQTCLPVAQFAGAVAQIIWIFI